MDPTENTLLSENSLSSTSSLASSLSASNDVSAPMNNLPSTDSIPSSENNPPASTTPNSENNPPASVSAASNITNKVKNEPNTESESLAKSPAAVGRSNKQKNADRGAAEVLKRMRELYETEFANIPANKRPKAKAWAARAAYFKPTEEEREAYIQEMIKNDRNALSGNNSGNKVSSNSGEYNSGLVEQLMAALDTATKVARQLKGATRKNKTNFNTTSKNVNANVPSTMNSLMNPNMSMVNKNTYNNSNSGYNSESSFTKSRRVSPLSSKKRKTKKANVNVNARNSYASPMEPLNF